MRPRFGVFTLGALILSALAIFGCGVGSTVATSTATATHTGPTATPTPPAHALAWFQQDAAQVGQIWASVNDGPAHQVTHMPAPPGDCVRDQHWSPPVFSPDLTHIVGGWGSGDCGDGPEQGDLYTVDAASGVATVMGTGSSCLGNIRLSLRQAGWVNATTIWWIDSHDLHEQTLGGACTTIASLGSSSGSTYTGAEDAVLRGNTLFYSTITGSVTGSVLSTIPTFALHRFDMTSLTMLPGAINLGSERQCVCSPGDSSSPGFDVSADGTHIVYQVVSPAAPGSGQEGVASSQFFYANADGSSAARIASYATATSMTRMQLAPVGHFVSISRALTSPTLLTASVTSPGDSGDPDLHVYNPDGFTYAVWDWHGTSFWTGSKQIPNDGSSIVSNVNHYTLGVAAGTVAAAGGNNPWYTIGH